MHIGKRLKGLRRLRGMTQAKVSDGITSDSHYSNIEGGRYAPLEGTLKLLAERLSVPSTYLINQSVIDEDMTVLLDQYEDLLDAEEIENARFFFEEHKKSFEYIPSLQQELHFNLLRCTDFFKAGDYDTFGRYYSDTIIPYVDLELLTTLSASIREKYNYISGLYHYIKKNHKESIQFFSCILKMNDDASLHARLTFNIALAHYYLHDYTGALVYAEQSKDHYLNLHNWKKTAECYNLLAVLYKLLNDFDNAELYIHKGLNILNDETEKTYLTLLHNSALIYREKEQYDQALEAINRCISLKKDHNPDDLFISYHVKLKILLRTKDLDAVGDAFELAKNACTTKLDEIHLQVIEGKLCLLRNQSSDYEALIQQCADYYLKHEHWKCLKGITEEFAEYYAKIMQYKKAYNLNKLCLHAIKKIYKEVL
ncbi:helix-turn-helix transcriptional regulator [Sporosarcina limicola]|uniref:Transcriptional regulator with XRE-family HTH domain n=1 Tax=Sporosarcina limicola TaxID=34101 RepID=A0A927R4N4_9BACL|nr:helix-turn-helix transcriptional regulator [Sporosarcina limicola]MBE1555093.1 transcriptional regulator with XRE-family HTH domain [Sporosarcina limicola]